MNSEKQIKIIETPRDGIQGLNIIIPTRKKIEYINLLLQCGIDTVEVGSFVSPRTIPQMAETAEVLENLDYSKTNSKIAVLAVLSLIFRVLNLAYMHMLILEKEKAKLLLLGNMV